MAFDDVEGEAEEEVFGGGSDGEGVGVVVAWLVVAAAFGGVVARGVVVGGGARCLSARRDHRAFDLQGGLLA